MMQTDSYFGYCEGLLLKDDKIFNNLNFFGDKMTH